MSSHSDRQLYAISMASTYATPSPTNPDLRRFKHLISLPESSFTPETTVYKQLWPTDLTEPELKSLHKLAHRQLERAIKSKIKALADEIGRLNDKLEAGLQVPRHEEFEDLKGDVCTKVLERWGHEKAVEEMTGRRATIPASGQQGQMRDFHFVG